MPQPQIRPSGSDGLASNQSNIHAQPGRSTSRQHLYNLMAWLCFGLGFLGLLLPLMPTTVFWICATWLWLRSRPERVRFLVEHPQFGASIRAFLERGEICRTGKTAAIASMAGSFGIWWALVQPGWVLALVVGSILATVALWIGTRPGRRPATAPRPAALVTLELGALVNPPGRVPLPLRSRVDAPRRPAR